MGSEVQTRVTVAEPERRASQASQHSTAALRSAAQPRRREMGHGMALRPRRSVLCALCPWLRRLEALEGREQQSSNSTQHPQSRPIQPRNYTSKR